MTYTLKKKNPIKQSKTNISSVILIDIFVIYLMKFLINYKFTNLLLFKLKKNVFIVWKLFTKRPIWSRISLLCNMPSDLHQYLKLALPTIAYYIVCGPWRHGWCRLGIDPRKLPNCKFYQTIDFRIRKSKRNRNPYAVFIAS